MKPIINTSSIVVFGLIAVTGCYTPMDEAPDYEAVSSIVTPAGKTLSAGEGNLMLTFPPGAVSENMRIEFPTSDDVYFRGENNVPYALFTSEDEMIRFYSSKLNLLPKEFVFQQPVSVHVKDFDTIYEPHVFRLAPGTDPYVPMNWEEVTEGLTITEDNSDLVTNLIYEFSTAQFSSYIFGDGATESGYLVNSSELPSFPYYSEKPKLSGGKYSAFIADLNGGFFYLNVAFINQPVNNQSFKVYNAYDAGAFNNTNAQYAEVRGGFVCDLVNSSLYCDEIHFSESGTIKYLITTENGKTVHKLLLKGVVVKDPETGRKNEINGYVYLGV